MLSKPDRKVRREGQTAAFCCKVSGTPGPDQYQWYDIYPMQQPVRPRKEELDHKVA